VGGSALVITGEVDLDRVTRTGVLGRLLGGGARPRETAVGDRTLVELPAKAFRGLGDDFRGYLRRRLPQPWPASAHVVDYLASVASRVYLRGERAAGEATGWYVQLTFSGCAGQAQTSSEVAAHWAARWCREEWEVVARALVERGFTARALDGRSTSATTFLPAGVHGYAAYDPTVAPEENDEDPRFALDASAHETDADEAAALIATLEAGARTLMSDGRCRCQLCDPSFDPGSFAGPAAAPRTR
jgi:hypothetical protein